MQPCHLLCDWGCSVTPQRCRRDDYFRNGLRWQPPSRICGTDGDLPLCPCIGQGLENCLNSKEGACVSLVCFQGHHPQHHKSSMKCIGSSPQLCSFLEGKVLTALRTCTLVITSVPAMLETQGVRGQGGSSEDLAYVLVGF